MSDNNVLTQAGFDALEDELAQLHTHNDEIVAKMSEMDSRELSGSPEDAIFQLKREQGDIAQRIEYIRDILSDAKLTQGADDLETIDVGNRVKVVNSDTDEEVIFDIVGTTAVETEGNRVTDSSPIGIALIGHKVDDKVSIEIPDGTVTYKILDILRIPNINN